MCRACGTTRHEGEFVVCDVCGKPRDAEGIAKQAGKFLFGYIGLATMLRVACVEFHKFGGEPGGQTRLDGVDIVAFEGIGGRATAQSRLWRMASEMQQHLSRGEAVGLKERIGTNVAHELLVPLLVSRMKNVMPIYSVPDVAVKVMPVVDAFIDVPAGSDAGSAPDEWVRALESAVSGLRPKG